MNITESIVREYLIPEEYEKPKIEINSYFLKWNVKSYGISRKEVSELKRFLKNAIPHFDIIYELLNSLETSRAKYVFCMRNLLHIYIFHIVIKMIVWLDMSCT